MRLSGSVTIPKRPSTIGGLIGWARGVNRALAELRDRKIVGWKSSRNVNSQPPFWPTLSVINDEGTPAYKLTMKKGWVSSTHRKYGVQSVVTIEVTGIPGDPDPVANALSVVSGIKVWAALTESNQGEITAAAISSGTSWPTSSAAKLIGGDDQTGESGTRYVRLCEVVTVDGSVKVKVIHTGIIEHSAPTLVENTSNSISTNEARVLKQWNASNGQFGLRYLKGIDGVGISESGDYIQFTYSSQLSHPWKVTYADEVEGLGQWSVVGDTVYSQGDPVVVADITVAGDSGVIYLKITRDSESREVTAAVVEIAEELPESDYNDQYRIIATVDKAASPKVKQYESGEIRIRELMILENGDWRLASVDLSSREIYELPP